MPDDVQARRFPLQLLRHFSANDDQIRGAAQCFFLGVGQIMQDLAPLQLIG